MFNLRATLIAIKCGSLMVHAVGVSNINPKQKNEEKEARNDANKNQKVNVSPAPGSPAVCSPRCQSLAGPGGRGSAADSVLWVCSTSPQRAGPEGSARLPLWLPCVKMRA